MRIDPQHDRGRAGGKRGGRYGGSIRGLNVEHNTGGSPFLPQSRRTTCPTSAAPIIWRGLPAVIAIGFHHFLQFCFSNTPRAVPGVRFTTCRPSASNASRANR